MRIFLLFMIFMLACAGCEGNKEGSENNVLPKESQDDIECESSACDEKYTLSFGYATDSYEGFGEIIDVN